MVFGKDKRSSFGRSVLSGLLLVSMGMLLSGCSNDSLDPLVAAGDIPDRVTEKNVMTVERGDVVPVFEAEINLTEFNEVDYRLDKSKQTEFEEKYKVTDLELLVDVGDKVKKGDTLVAFKSETLDKKLRENELKKSEANLQIEHLYNLMAIDPSLDFSSEINELNGQISTANTYINDIHKTYDSINIVADIDGVVGYIDNAVKDGFIVYASPMVKVVSDSGLYVFKNSTESSDEEDITETSLASSDPSSYSGLEFNIGDRFNAKTFLSEYVVEVCAGPGETENASAGDAVKKSDKIYFRLVDEVGVKEKKLVLYKEMDEIKNVCHIDRRALSYYNGEYYVFKEQEDGLFRAVKVKPGVSMGLDIVIEEGLEEGDVVSLPAR